MHGAVTDGVYGQYLASLLAGERARCIEIVERLCGDGMGLRDLYVDIFQRSLYRIGELWEHRRVSVAVEHLATAITERLMSLVQARVFAGPLRERSVVIACVADEFHQIGGRMVADLFELNGWRGYFLGANTPVDDLLRLIDDRRPDMVGMSLSIYFNLPSLRRALDAVCGAHPGLQVIVGGQAFRWGGADVLRRYGNVTYVATIDELEKIVARA
ncbi:MAG: cobalamin-dependent protein [bacterium]|nr:cobalamin-dependent protein [Candidatus Sumerlaeota bacterium]